MITVSIDGLLTPALNEGLSPNRVSEFDEALVKAQRELMERRGVDIGFYDAPAQDELIAGLQTEVKRLRSLSEDLLVLGIGGSSLGGQALVQGLGAFGQYGVRVHFVDNVDPDTFADLLDRLSPEKTAAVVITKSGGTVETLAQLLIIRRWFTAAVGQGECRKRLVFVTDPEKGLLRNLANSEGIRSFDVPPNVGGRFSVLTAVGLLPAAYLGIDIARVCRGAVAMAERVTGDSLDTNPAAAFARGALLAQGPLQRPALVMMPYADSLRLMSSWFVQLWAESLGKRIDRAGRVVRVGQTPIVAVGATDQHAQLQLFVEGPKDKAVVLVSAKRGRRSLLIPDELQSHEEVSFLHGRDLGEVLVAERRATRAALLDAGVPVIDVTVPMVDEESFGGLLMLFESACALTGLCLNINPFDQPGVEAGKLMALGLLGRQGFEQHAQGVLAKEASS